MSSDLAGAGTEGDSSASQPGGAPSAGPEPVPGERLGVPQGASRSVVEATGGNSSIVFFVVVAVATIALDMASKTWAATHLDTYPGTVEIWPHYVTLVLARNRGGAWGLLQTASENVRRPFFLLVSVVAIGFILALYRRLQARQRALKWGLPLVFGGAVGNVLDRVRFGHVIDFIDCHVREHHWPTFNIADVAICVGVGLMALDMFFSKRGDHEIHRGPRVPPAQSGEPVPDWHGAHGPLAAGDPPAAHDESPAQPASGG
jgi:lipoprotein signal peptidase